MSDSNCCFLTCIQIQEAGKVVWYSYLFKNFPHFVVIHTVKGSGIVNKAEVDAFLELSCFFDDPVDVGNLICGSSAFSKSSLNIWKFTVHVLLKPGLENFKHYFTSMWDECNCAIVWTFFGIAFLWDWNKKRLFPVLWPILSFPNLLRGPFNSEDHYVYYCWQESLRRNGVAIIVNKRVWNAVLGCNLKINRMISLSKANHSISQQSKSIPWPVMLKKPKFNRSMKTYKTF